MDGQVTWQSSVKGKPKVCYEGFVYNKNETSKSDQTVDFYVCERKRKDYCSGRLHLRGNTVLKISDHNHAPDTCRQTVLKAVDAIKLQASTTEETTMKIIARQCCIVSEMTAARLPTERALKRQIQRTRNRNSLVPPLPASLEELNIPEDYKTFDNGEPFLLHDSGPGPNRLLIFSTHNNLRLLMESHHWYADGTFKVMPALFHQLYTIHSCCYGVMLPLVFALMHGKTTTCYRRVLQALRELQPNLAPTTLMCDFESAAISAFQLEFPQIVVTGCFFHLGQCCWRKCQQLGLTTIYAEEESLFASWLRCLPALAFVPIDQVVAAFERLTETPDFVTCMTENGGNAFVDYFEDTWIGSPPRRQGAERRTPLFPIALWNQYERTMLDMPRTNNSIEAWHNRMQSLVGAYFPHVFRFIDSIKKEQLLNMNTITQILSGQPPPPKRRKHVKLDDRIKTVVRNQQDRDIVDVLKSISHCYNL